MFDKGTEPEVEPTWEYISDKLKDFQNEVDGIYNYIAAVIAHDHRSLKPKNR